jgi:hypothetical protein
MLTPVSVFAGVRAVPDSTGPSTVAVLQISHALAAGTRSAALAGLLSGRTGALLPVKTATAGWLIPRRVEVLRMNRQLARDTKAGLVPRPHEPAPACPIVDANGCSPTCDAKHRITRTPVFC